MPRSDVTPGAARRPPRRARPRRSAAHAYWKRPSTTGITVPVPGHSASRRSTRRVDERQVAREQQRPAPGRRARRRPRAARRAVRRRAGPRAPRAARSRPDRPRSRDRTPRRARARHARRASRRCTTSVALSVPMRRLAPPVSSTPASSTAATRIRRRPSARCRRAAGPQRVADDDPTVRALLEHHVVAHARALGGSPA